MTLYYAIALLVAFYLMVVAEFFLPTGGMLGAGAVAVLVAAVAIAFSHSTTAGISVGVFVVLTTPLVLIGMVRAWPHTPIGRRMLNRRPGQSNDAPPRTTARGTAMDQLPGHVGKAVTNLLPSGLVSIDGEKLDAVSIGMPIDAGSSVIVTSVDAGRIHVRPATDEEASGQTDAKPQSPPSLEKSLESFDFET